MTTPGGRHLTALALPFLLLGVLTAVPAQGQAGAPAEAASSDWLRVSAGDAHTCGIRAPGQLWCWGDDGAGQLGNGAEAADQPVPIRIGTANDWRSVSAGAFHTCGIRAPGRLWCWGRDAESQLGNPGTGTRTSPVAITPSISNWTSVSAGAFHTCGRRANGRLYCWGHDGHGQLGNGPALTDVQSVPGLVKGGFTNWVSVSVNSHTTCGRRANGRLYCWGRDNFGMLGNGGNDVDRSTPGLVAGGATDWVSVSVGAAHVCGRRATKRIYCWGNDGSGQLGNGAATGPRDTPQLVGGATKWTAVAAGSLHTCGRSRAGRILCWGDTQSGQSGTNIGSGTLANPLGVAGGATDWATLDLGGFHTCARTTTGRLYCWGEDGVGCVGNDLDFVDAREPDEVFVA